MMQGFTDSLSIPKIMGILNVTPDSFSDGGKFHDPISAINHAESLISQGADILDIGAESTRPGSETLDPETEIARLEPVLSGIRTHYKDIPISIDTRKSIVVKMCLPYGIQYVNDISALRHDPDLAGLLGDNPSLRIVLMHMQGEPGSMQDQPAYKDVLQEVITFFEERISFCRRNGIEDSQILLDPGIGFGKNLEHNILLLRSLRTLSQLGFPIVLGASRKRFINEIYSSPPSGRLPGTLAASLSGLLQGTAIIRVHDVAEHKQFFDVISRILPEDLWTF